MERIMARLTWKLVLAFFAVGFISLGVGVFNIGGVSVETGIKVAFGFMALSLACFTYAACTGSNRKMTT